MKIEWKENVAFDVISIPEYYLKRSKLKFGPTKSFPVLDFLCENACTPRDEVMQKFSLKSDDLSTILANFTMALQGKGSVKPPAEGGWYAGDSTQKAYFVAPSFAAAWKAHQKSGEGHCDEANAGED